MRRPKKGVTSGCYKVLQGVTSPAMLEKSIENYLREQWTYRTRGECVKLPPIFYKGMPDQMGMCAPNIICYIETKRPVGGVLSPAQIKVHERWRKRGHWVEVAYTKEMVDNLIDTVCAYITSLTHTRTKE